jgi:predicted membrane protein
MRKSIVRREIWAEGAPIPEMIGGAIIGALCSMILTYVPDLRGALDPSSVTLYLIVGAAALIGAVVSYFLARRHVVAARERVETRDASRRAA